jgi:hypothetical protein
MLHLVGDAAGRDMLIRYYNYPSPDWLRANYANAGNWSLLSIETGEVTGFDAKRAAMLFVKARNGHSLANSEFWSDVEPASCTTRGVSVDITLPTGDLVVAAFQRTSRCTCRTAD